MRAIVVLPLLVFVLAIGVARADNKDEAKKLVAAADVAYKLGKFDEALANYDKAYQLFHAPGLLFNMAQCHRNLKNFEKAVFFYEGYLREAVPNAPDRTIVEDVLKETRIALEKQRTDVEAARRAENEAQAKAIEAARIRAEAEAELARKERERLEAERLAGLNNGKGPVTPPPPEKPIYKKWWFWTAVGGAALVVGGGVVLATTTTNLVPPSGSTGNLDRR
jgi:tetratricopeptide (TPR) repeat protein